MKTVSPHAFIQRLNNAESQTIVFYGTSLTEHGAWVGELSDELEQRFPSLITSINSGGSGQHSGWGVENLNDRVLKKQPDVVFIEFSVNDSTARFEISLDQARKNLNWMIDQILAVNPNCEIILQVMNPVIDRPEGHAGWRPQLETYQEIYREVAQERGLLLIDHMPAWEQLLETNEDTFRDYVPDGLHPAAPGYEAIVVPEQLRALGLA